MYFRELKIWHGMLRCVRVTGSSSFRDCDFYLDESQVLNGVYFKFMVVSFKQCFYVIRL
ncbi:hypothetical protein HanRHA438_Chr10g0442101 [Helianthus annuus]|nr:hypothetical protein HanRHA438_Chr10g0442101 [Helianthus annuus]